MFVFAILLVYLLSTAWWLMFISPEWTLYGALAVIVLANLAENARAA